MLEFCLKKTERKQTSVTKRQIFLLWLLQSNFHECEAASGNNYAASGLHRECHKAV